MQRAFEGFHGEWNLGSPGGWEYQRMIQQIYLPARQEIKKLSGIDLELDVDNKAFKPSLKFAEILLEKSRSDFPDLSPFIVLIAEEGTLEDVVENSRFVDYLKTFDGVDSVLIGPRQLEISGEDVVVDGKKVTTIFMDFNNTVLAKLEEKHSIEPIIKAIKDDIMVNARGMECINAKGVFEAVDLDFRDQLSETTIYYTPWTRKFYKRETIGPNGEHIEDLVDWTRENRRNLILKPENGRSGIGIELFKDEGSVDEIVQKALDPDHHGDYIVQEFVPKKIWTELIPEIEGNKVVLNPRQTDFRCLITNKGIAGFLGRYGGIPTNVGSGGGVQPLGLVTSGQSSKEASKILNQALLNMDINDLKRIRQGIDERATQMKFIYINGPIPISLRPRIISPEQMNALNEYGLNLYKDTLILEKAYFDGKMDHILDSGGRADEIARMQPRHERSVAMMASDGLFDFGSGTEGN